MRTRLALAACLALAVLLIAAPLAAAEVFTVTRTDDPAPGPCLPDDCSLREAVAASNASTTVDDQIVVPANANPYAVDIAELAITDQVVIRGGGAGRTVLKGDGNNRIFGVASPGVAIEALTVSGGEGGFQNNGELTLRAVSVEHNTWLAAGAGIQSNGPLLIESSFIGFNQGGGTAGGGIQANDPVTLINSTMAGNTSNGSSAINGNALVTIASSAVVANTTTSTTAAALRGTPLKVRDSIFAENRNAVGLLNCLEPPTSQGGNVEDAATCAVGAADRPNVNPGLLPLGLYGGTTLLFGLQPTSPAVDFATACPPLDQRGFPRPLGAACDSGPFELQPTPPPAPDRAVSLLIGGGKLKLSGRGIVHLRLTCPSTEANPPCKGKVVLRTRAKVRFGSKRRKLPLASAPFSLGAGQSANVALKLAAAKASLVRDRKAARRVTIEAKVGDAAGNAATLDKKARLVTG